MQYSSPYTLQRGDVLLVDFEGNIREEKLGCRPAVVLQSHDLDDDDVTTIVAPVTSQYDADNLYPTEVELPADECGLEVDSIVQLTHIRSISVRGRVEDIFGWIPEDVLTDIDSALVDLLGLPTQ